MLKIFAKLIVLPVMVILIALSLQQWQNFGIRSQEWAVERLPFLMGGIYERKRI